MGASLLTLGVDDLFYIDYHYRFNKGPRTYHLFLLGKSDL